MTVDISKIKPGDKGAIEFTFGDRIGPSDPMKRGGSVRVAWPWGASSWLTPEQISHCISHTPTPREIKVGDMVTWGEGYSGFKVRGLHDGMAWLPDCREDFTKVVCELRHYEPRS